MIAITDWIYSIFIANIQSQTYCDIDICLSAWHFLDYVEVASSIMLEFVFIWCEMHMGSRSVSFYTGVVQTVVIFGQQDALSQCSILLRTLL